MELRGIFDQVSVQDEMSWENVQVFPLLQPGGQESTYALIDELLDRDEAEITEVDQEGEVPTIKVCNRSDLDAIILDGMELRGAKQNRMVDVTIIVGKHTETPIPVTCVEQGRWSYRSRSFASSQRTVASKLRSLKSQMVVERFAHADSPRTDQGLVWARVGDYISRSKSSSLTSAMDDVFAQHESEIEKVLTHLKAIDAYGAIVAVNGEIIALDLVDNRQTFRKLWEILLRGYAIDALLDATAEYKPLTRHDVESWLGSLVAETQLTPHQVPGVGQYYAASGPQVAGGVVADHGQMVHVALFPVGPSARVPAAVRSDW